MSGGANIFALDHIVLTVRDIDATCSWYERVLGMRRLTFEGGHTALHFGAQKINLHPAQSPYEPHAELPRPGTADLCFLSTAPLPDIVAALRGEGVMIEHGPVEQIGAQAVMDSVYVRDPDGNLIEIAHYR